MKKSNYGFLHSPPQEQDFQLGVVEKEVLMPDGQWMDYLPEIEFQKSYKTGFETYGCVSFSALNCLEILFNQRGDERNFSDRFTVVKSGTTWGRGNYFRKVAESIRLDGVLDEEHYPFVDTRAEYYQDIANSTNRRAYNLPVHWEWLMYMGWQRNSVEILTKGLKYGPLQVSVWAWPRPDKKGIYQKADTSMLNHAVTLIGYKFNEYWIIWDHYKREIKHLAWDYNIGSPLLYSLSGKVNIAKKYAGKLIRNEGSPKYYYSNGKQIAHIRKESIFYFGRDGVDPFWGNWEDAHTIPEPIKEDLKF